MSLRLAFEICEEDIGTVLSSNAVHVANSNGVPFDVMAEQLLLDWTAEEFDQVAKAALDASTDLDGQTEAAHAEIRAILVKKGVLER